MAELIKLLVEIFFDFFTFKKRAFAQPDQKDSPLISGPQDASAQQMLDIYNKQTKS